MKTMTALIFVLGLTAAGTGHTLDLQAPERPGERFRPYTEHAPATPFLVQATNSYEAGQYGIAYEQFLHAARWSDKFAQYNLGILHLRGEGTAYDPLRGWAWLELAAERGYPQFRESADALRALFNAEERRRAQEIFDEEIEPRYGDAATFERTAREMRFGRNKATGSRLGSQGMLQMLRVYEGGAGQRNRNGEEFYDRAKWDFEAIADYELALMNAAADGRVSVRELELDSDSSD